ncbi:hypothetical protein SAMD00019534_076810 [Acytostelium subglobosum LB1]|uniref:hypothetical protein n=1 Tax=Acytostelium subglobosum LB1 TaxID=1410327 RepID=UPI0006449A86|nr:hypothetical protein SAMD00019534_076810 [Acytostelium subglobosum LB1]GAM24506.1 hypothetical protein SAMD00019534_076810 [Acytostelium subglobosum LB1]|eukprot:XP_012752832.1 hypothetical protein SAMD00019534_076810 [Acytostelium subglobosum LB1]
MAERRAAIFGTEKDQQNCPFYLKIGACRHGDRCSRLHNKPLASQTIILPNLYQSPYLKRPANLPPIQATEEEIQKHFDDFYEDIHEGLAKYGTVELLYVTANLGDHLIGNVYVRFSTEESAAAACEGLRGRYYDGRPIVAEFSPVTDFNESRCRQFDLGTCDRGGFCNFMHLHNPSKPLYVKLFGDRKSRSPSPSRRKDFSGGGGGGGRGDYGRGDYGGGGRDREFRDRRGGGGEFRERRDYRDRDYRDREYRDRRGDFDYYREDDRGGRRGDYRGDYRGGGGGSGGGDEFYRERGGDFRDSRGGGVGVGTGGYPDQPRVGDVGYKRSRSRSQERDRYYDGDVSSTGAPVGSTPGSGSGGSGTIPIGGLPVLQTESGVNEPTEKKIKLDGNSNGVAQQDSSAPYLTESQTIQWASSEERRTDDYDVKTSLTQSTQSPPR